MPLHDWSKVDAGVFHAFHTTWIGAIQNALNHGLLPDDYYALAEQHMGGFVADILTLHVPPKLDEFDESQSLGGQGTGGTAVAEAKPQTQIHESIEIDLSEIQRSLAIRHVSSHRIIALLEIVSPANKDREDHVAAFVAKTIGALSRGIHVLMVDLFAPGRYDPLGMHYRIRETIAPNLVAPNIESMRSTLASYQASRRNVDMFIEHVASDSVLPDMPIFLNASRYVNVPLEATYRDAWEGMPSFWRKVLTGEIS